MKEWLEKIYEILSKIFYVLAEGKDNVPSLEPAKEALTPEEELKRKILRNSPGIGPKMTNLASKWFFHKEITNKEYLVLIDYDLPETQPRMYVVNRYDGTSRAYKVAHGKKSDPNQDGVADVFSNKDGSNQSSLGAMVTLSRYGKKAGGWSKFDFAMQLKGLEKGLNDNVSRRAIVFHSSAYVNDVKGELIGDSLGCFAVSLDTAKVIIDDVDNGALWFSYHKSLDKIPKGAENFSLKRGIRMIKDWEGFRQFSYKDPAGVWTIGYGMTVWPSGERVKPQEELREVEASKLVESHIEREILPQMADLVKVPLNENQYNALVSFIYNLGIGNFAQSTLLKKLNKKDYDGAADELLRWTKANGVELQGLVNRRKQERAMFLGEA